MTDNIDPNDRGLTLNWIERMVLLVLVIVLVCCCLVVVTVTKMSRRIDNMDQVSQTTPQARLDNRIITCQVALAVGAQVDHHGPCFDPELLKHYDPNAVKPILQGETEILSLICRIMRDGRSPNLPPQCRDVP